MTELSGQCSVVEATDCRTRAPADYIYAPTGLARCIPNAPGTSSPPTRPCADIGLLKKNAHARAHRVLRWLILGARGGCRKIHLRFCRAPGAASRPSAPGNRTRESSRLHSSSFLRGLLDSSRAANSGRRETRKGWSLYCFLMNASMISRVDYFICSQGKTSWVEIVCCEKISIGN